MESIAEWNINNRGGDNEGSYVVDGDVWQGW